MSALASMDELIPRIEQAMRLSPRDNNLPLLWGLIGDVHLLQSQIDEAVVYLEEARNANPAHPYMPHLAAAYALKGETDRAAAELAEARRLVTDGRYTSTARLKAVGYWGSAQGPRPLRSHLSPRPSAGRGAGGVRPVSETATEHQRNRSSHDRGVGSAARSGAAQGPAKAAGCNSDP